ncbi:hypothetical protein EMMF5_006615, partial [Cystobasidiomycetes sp. EMM_F5]
YHGNGNPEDELVLFEFEEMKQTLEAELAHSKQSWSAVWGQPGNKHRFVLACIMTILPQLNGSAIIAYYCESIFVPTGNHVA